MILTSFDSSLPMLYITAGVIVGAADGISYITTLSNCIKWFPDKKGLISGISVGAYGTGSLIFKYINGSLINNVGVSKAFLYWGLIAMALILIGSQLLKDAPLVVSNSIDSKNTKEFTVKEMLKTKEAYALFVIFFSACMNFRIVYIIINRRLKIHIHSYLSLMLNINSFSFYNTNCKITSKS